MADSLTDMEFDDCTRCGSTAQASDLIGGECKACHALVTDSEPTVEVPVAVLEKLAGMARTRHPSVCNKDAFRFSRVLDSELDEFEWNPDR